MSIDQSDTLELLGLSGSFPRPGWVILDAARDRLFTGEVRFHTSPEVSVSFERGHIYVAERVTEPSLGARLVDAGMLTASELERGVIRLGTVEHIGRLFERVPSLDRHAVTLAAEMLTDECVSWLAAQHVPAVDAMPYRQHPSGVLRWHQLSMYLAVQPGDPLPAPEPTAAPVESAPPPPLHDGLDADFDDLIQWDQPGWLDDSDDAAVSDGLVERDESGSDVPAESIAGVRFDDELDGEFPEPDDLYTADTELEHADDLEHADEQVVVDEPVVLDEPQPDEPQPDEPQPDEPQPDVVSPAGEFELIWPSGTSEPTVGSATAMHRVVPAPEPEADTEPVSDDMPAEAAVTLDDVPATSVELADSELPVRSRSTNGDGHVPAAAEPDLADGVFSQAETAEPEPDTADDAVISQRPHHDQTDHDQTDHDQADHDQTDTSGQVALAVRRAVATIDTGSLDARRRLAASVDDEPSRGVAADLANETGQLSPWSVRHTDMVVPIRRSVFDDVPAPTLAVADDAAECTTTHDDDEPSRASALRRLIGSLRTR